MSGWKWDVTDLRFYDGYDCDNESSFIDPATGTTPIESGSAAGSPGAYWSASYMFYNGGIWGGRSDDGDDFYVGLEFEESKDVKCIKLNQPSLEAAEVRVQVKDAVDDMWSNAWIVSGLSSEDSIVIECLAPTSAPTPSPDEEVSFHLRTLD